jgi:AraC-like DNA-binding protein
MKPSEKKFLECEGLKIAASWEFGENCAEHPVYFAATVLFHVERGVFNIKTGAEQHSFSANSFGLIRKHTHSLCTKTWSEEEGSFKMLGFTLDDSFVNEVIGSVPLPEDIRPVPNNLYRIPNNGILAGLMNSISAYFDEGGDVDRSVVRLKTLESLIGIIQAKPELAHIFFEYAKSVRADLRHFMEYHYMQKHTIEELAYLSGRSASTFNREFRKLFNQSPHQWIKEKRLAFARSLLQRTELTASDVYLQAGFEDLAHFSRSFKSFFGINPSQVKELA